ncbi:MAG: hypothetical protein ACPHK0_08260, partial [Dehalococcoidia bacterium]
DELVFDANEFSFQRFFPGNEWVSTDVIKDWSQMDMFYSYRDLDALGGSFNFSIGARNVFDRMPQKTGMIAGVVAEKGLVPVTGEPILSAERYSEDRQFVFIGSETEVDLKSKLVELGHPVLTINFDDANDIGGEFFRWEFATAVAGSILEIYPFDQPEVETAKQRARDLVGVERSESNSSSVEEVVEVIGHQNTGTYISLVAFLPESQEVTDAFHRLRQAITLATGIPTTFGYGPRYLHSTGQLFKGGPKNNLVIGFVSGKYDDLPIPGAEYTFGELLNAQAQGDFAVMREVGQSVKEIYTDTDPVDVVEKMTTALVSL